MSHYAGNAQDQFDHMGALTQENKRLRDQVDAQAQRIAAELDYLRPTVRRFARAMEDALRRHDDRGERGWIHESRTWLENRLAMELEELRRAGGEDGNVLREAADVANFAMMIADVCYELDLALLARPEADRKEQR